MVSMVSMTFLMELFVGFRNRIAVFIASQLNHHQLGTSNL
jgi:hypothetical protein